MPLCRAGMHITYTFCQIQQKTTRHWHNNHKIRNNRRKIKLDNQTIQVFDAILNVPFIFIIIRLRLICNNWRPPSLSELTPIIFNAELTHFGSKTTNYS